MLSSIAKLSSLESFELYIFSFGFATFDICSLVARSVVIMEFLLGSFLLFNLLHRFMKWITAAFLAVFSIFLLWRLMAGDTESCHCMGDIVDMNPTQSLIKNAFLAVMLAFSWKTDSRVFNRQNLIAFLTAAVTAATVFLVCPPDFYYRKTSESNDLSQEAFRPVADSLDLSKGRRIICFYSATCEHCRHCASKMAGIIRRHDIPLDSVSVLFMQTHAAQDSVVTAFYAEHGDGLVLPYHDLHPFDFIPLTNGSMPLVTLFKDGNLIKEYDYLSLDEKELSSFFNE
jgi:uncharacterized membrane protein YphA (DoxX/SURF4 family)